VLYNSVVFSITNDDDDTISDTISGQQFKKDTSWYINSVLKRRKHVIHSGIIYSSSRLNQLIDQPKSSITISSKSFVSNLLNRLSLNPSEKDYFKGIVDEDMITAKNIDNDKKQDLCMLSKDTLINNHQTKIIKKDRIYKDSIIVDETLSTFQRPSHGQSYSNTHTSTSSSSTSSSSSTIPFHPPTPKSSIMMPKAVKPNLTKVLMRQRSQWPQMTSGITSQE